MREQNAVKATVCNVKMTAERMRKRMAYAQPGVIKGDSRHGCRVVYLFAHDPVATVGGGKSFQNGTKGI